MAKPSSNVCPVCFEEKLKGKRGNYTFKIKDGNNIREVTVSDLAWKECEECGEVVFDNVAAEKIEQERYRALGLLTPEELRIIRKELGFTQATMADYLRVGSKSYCRWENGFSIQTKAMDRLIRLAYEEKREEEERKQRGKRASEYLSQLKHVAIGQDKNELFLAAHGTNLSSKELKEIGKKVFRKK